MNGRVLRCAIGGRALLLLAAPACAWWLPEESGNCIESMSPTETVENCRQAGFQSKVSVGTEIDIVEAPSCFRELRKRAGLPAVAREKPVFLFRHKAECDKMSRSVGTYLRGLGE